MATVSVDRRQGVNSSNAVKTPCKAATTAALTLSGEQTVDGVACVTDDRVLVKDQATASENGIYNVDTGSWTRAKDFDGTFDVVQGTLVPVANGTTNGGQVFRISTANPITIGTTSLAFTFALDAATLTFLQSGIAAGNQVSRTVEDKIGEAHSVKDAKNTGGVQVAGDFSVDDTTGIQSVHDGHLNVTYPAGNYQISAAIELRAWSKVTGAGRSQYLSGSVPSSSNITGTRIIQTAAAIAMRSDATLDAAIYDGNINVSDLTVQGRNNTTTVGTYGLYCLGAQYFSAERVLASFFANSGIYVAASVVNHLNYCSATYCEENGLFLDRQADYQPSSYNAIMTNVIGGTYTQNGDANIKLGTATSSVNLIGVDSESAGAFYPSGDGYGLHITGSANNVNVLGSHFENNKIHIVLGADDSVTTVPQNIRITGNRLWSVSTGSTKIRINAGRGIRIEDNDFFGGGSIYLGPRADNPIISNNRGYPTVTNVDGDNISYNNMETESDWPEPDISAWTTFNCSVAVEEVVSPAGNIPVYKITPTAGSQIQVYYIVVGIAPFNGPHHTYGFWIKYGAATEMTVGWQVLTTGGPTAYSNHSTEGVDSERFSDSWKWVSFGRSIPSTDTGNFRLILDFPVTTTDPIYISAFQSRLGIINVPFHPIDLGIATLANSATPSVFAMKTALTGGTTTITDLIDGALGQELTIIAEHTITITDGTNIFLSGSTNFVMAATDTLTLIRKADGNWYEIGRSDNT
jgi:hypothetical protein